MREDGLQDPGSDVDSGPKERSPGAGTDWPAARRWESDLRGVTSRHRSNAGVLFGPTSDAGMAGACRPTGQTCIRNPSWSLF